jgi:chromosome segregation ATPase
MTTSRTATALLVLALLLGACSPAADTGELRVELARAREDRAALEARVADLEDALGGDPEGGDALPALDARVAELSDRLDALADALATEVGAERAAREGADVDLDGQLTELDVRLSDLRATVTQLVTSVEELTDEVSSLETRFVTHRDDAARHR